MELNGFAVTLLLEVRNDQESQRRIQSHVGKGKNLGGPYKTKKEAEKRLRQVEFFKHKGH